MNVLGFRRMLAKNGDTITLRRITNGVRSDVPNVLCSVKVGAAEIIVGDVQQTADEILLSSVEATAAGWGEPRHGDRVVYSDGRETLVQGRTDVDDLGDGNYIWTIRCVGG